MYPNTMEIMNPHWTLVDRFGGSNRKIQDFLVQYFSYRTKLEFISNYINYDQPLWYLHNTLRVSNDIRLSNDMIVFT